jgi:diadenosine tetraphosphate (Ap4A) HIT family hydrolase
MAERTIFDEIVAGTIPSFSVWEDDAYMAFLTPFPNTPGFTVVIPKKNPGDNYLDVADEVLTGLALAAKKVARQLQKAFDVQRVGLVLEGEGVPHLHIKLIPMHGDVSTIAHVLKHQEFYPQYTGWLSTVEGPRMNDEQLKEIQQKIQGAAQ